MALGFGKQLLNTSDCAGDQTPIIAAIFTALGNPYPTTGDGYGILYQDNSTGDVYNVSTGDLITLTPGSYVADAPIYITMGHVGLNYVNPLYLTGSDLGVKVDGVTVDINGSGELYALVASSVTATEPISVAGGNIVLSYSDGLEKDSNDDLRVLLDEDTGLGFDGTSPHKKVQIQWDQLDGYTEGDDELLGHEATFHTVEFKKVVDWLKKIEGYSGAQHQVIFNDNGSVTWKKLTEVMKKLPGWNAASLQSVGHDTGTDPDPEWQDDTDICPDP